MESKSKPQSKSLVSFFPILGWLPKYERSWLRFDLIAGLTVVALLIPEGMAYAQIAGMPPQTAFYAAPIGLLAFAIFGTSRQLVVAVSAIIATMSFATVSLIAPPNTTEFYLLTAALAVLAGSDCDSCRVTKTWAGSAVLLRVSDGRFYHRPGARHHGEAAAQDPGHRRRQW